MDFRRGRTREEPEINLIPMIDVLLVILIFLVVTTTYTRFSELKINLPQAGGAATAAQDKPIHVGVDASEHYAINDKGLNFTGVAALSTALKQAASNQSEPTIVINADARAPHQAVINIMEAARMAGYERITFTAQKQSQ